MRKILCCLLVVFILFLVGCSEAAERKDKFSNTVWVYEADKLQGIEFTSDGQYYMWEIMDKGDGTGILIPAVLEKYDIHKNTLTLYVTEFPVSSGEGIIQELKFKCQINGDSMSLYSEYDGGTAKLKKIDISIHEYAKTIGLFVPKQGEAGYE